MIHKCDEIAQFVDARWICAPEAMWKLHKFSMTWMCSFVDRLQVHLLNMHQVKFQWNHPIKSILSNPRSFKTMLTQIFKTNILDQRQNYRYREFLEHNRWISSTSK